jgi:hypothetical protein
MAVEDKGNRCLVRTKKNLIIKKNFNFKIKIKVI